MLTICIHSNYLEEWPDVFLISTALLSNPKLLIADEPTPGLDQKNQLKKP